MGKRASAQLLQSLLPRMQQPTPHNVALLQMYRSSCKNKKCLGYQQGPRPLLLPTRSRRKRWAAASLLSRAAHCCCCLCCLKGFLVCQWLKRDGGRRRVGAPWRRRRWMIYRPPHQLQLFPLIAALLLTRRLLQQLLHLPP